MYSKYNTKYYTLFYVSMYIDILYYDIITIIKIEQKT